MSSRRPVELGFVEAVAAAWRLRSDQFPCKVGGRPAWLGEAGLPGPSELRCGACEQPCAFLLQLYAPIEGRPEAFHRSLFLFGCRRPSCYRSVGSAPGCLRVFRNQLPRKNDTYSYDPPPEDPPVEEETCVNLQLKCGAHLCRVCGCLGSKRCSRCHKAHYCSKDHQAMDWRAGHKVSCTESDEISESLDEKLLEKMAKHETQEDKIFQKFKERISLEPEQIIRYCRDGEGPIWISGENVPQETEIPNCPCGSKRVFEFQVMPQLLNHLKVDSLEESIDWGILAIYTCAENCSLGNHYTEEFIWKQDISSSV
ncbi:programmed cell death protein 2 isoform X2 [Hemicordylus capensis]|uniref:programmed cell death protein 2 isoform X2 n=1 Tax=Hemicordylus capensis TaxID=884348 RepID=UPI00230311EE|nr:programmed cell death protein 2 isoform X2 [Hemicordylus capensis]